MSRVECRTTRGTARWPLVIVYASIWLAACGVVPAGSVDGPVMRYPNRSFSADGMGAEIAGLLELENGCLYVVPPEGIERFPILWPAGTRWNADTQVVITPGGVELGVGDGIRGGGGYLYVDDVHRLAGDDAAALAERCADNIFGEIAVVNNQRDAMGPAGA
jgi:hypothetical protein